VEQNKHIKIRLSNGSGVTGNVTVSSTPSGNLREVRLKVLGDIRREVTQKFGLDSIRFGSLSSFPLENIVSVSASIAADMARLNREWDEFCQQLESLPATLPSRAPKGQAQKPRAKRDADTVSSTPPQKTQLGQFRQIPEED
jgi:hypothetical protein